MRDMTLVTITWEHDEEEKSSNPFYVDGSVQRELIHLNELAILFGKAASAFTEQNITVKLYPGNVGDYFSSKDVGLLNDAQPKVIN